MSGVSPLLAHLSENIDPDNSSAKSNNNGNHSKTSSFPSLVIAFLNTVRSPGKEKASPEENEKSPNANPNLSTENEGENGESTLQAIKLPENLEGLMRADHFPCQRHRWNTNEEIAAILISFAHHPEWLSKEVKIRPKSGSMLLYSRKKVRYRRDGYCWKKRKDGKTTREDHMKLKVQGTECIYGCYVHSAILPTFHRRCYWLLQNPDIVLVHYLNVPYPDDNKLIITSNVSLWGDKKEWTKEELISQLKPMFFSEEEPDLNNELELSTAETVEAIVMQLMEKQRLARQASTPGPSDSGPNSNSSTGSSLPPSNTGPVGAQPRLSSSSSSSSLVQMNCPNVVTATVKTEPGQGPSQSQPAPSQPQTQVQVPSSQPRVTTTTAVMTSTSQQDGRPFLLNLSQFQTTGGLIILNGKPPGPGTTQSHLTPSVVHSTNLNSQSAHAHGANGPTFMDVQNANGASNDRGAGQGQQGTSSVTPNTQQTLLIHHQNPHFTQNHTVHHPPQGSQGHTSGQTHHAHLGHGHDGELLTLEMSHEDIQQTLSANISGGELEPMSPSADDVFVNLDAFDILADLSDDLDHSHGQSHVHHHLMGTEQKTTIVDINPEWAYSEGGTKILIVGQFQNPHWEYSVHFGDLPVPAVYLQAGVLKCFCPPHSPGLVPIRVYSNGKQISNNSMVFEYKADLKVNLVPVPPSEASLKLCLIHRMECLEKCFQNFKGEEYGSRTLEDSVVKLCVEMMSQDWSPDSSGPLIPPEGDRGLTLLHLAAGLGYTRLLLTLIQWKRENPSILLSQEVDPWRTDDFGLIPLMWSAREGHVECGIVLAQYSPETLKRRDLEGYNPAQIAVTKGHVKLASELERIQNNRGSELSLLGFSIEDISLTPSFRRFQRCSEDFGLKDCFFGQPESSSELSLASEEDSKVLTLAEQIIAAIPDRIKKESMEDMSPSDSQDSSMISDPSDGADFSFEFSDRSYRYYDSETPCSSLSPSSSCLQSPCSSFTVDSPQPTTADFSEFLQAAAFEKDFSNLTLSDREQRELYEAAKVIQKAYRSYKGRKKLEEEEKEKVAAVIIQNYYRRYKQYAYLRQVTQAALVIQSQYRNYCENKRFKKSQDLRDPAPGFRVSHYSSGPNLAAQHQILRTYSQRRQNQAAKKIQQFMRQSKNNFWECEEPPKITERACRKREATVSLNMCPAPTKIALSSVQQRIKAQAQQKALLSTGF